jgi:hypothetical protein
MLDLRICFRETCDGIVLVDRTGLYNATTNPGGYGVQNETSPAAFTTYVLSIWGVGVDPSEPPLYTLDLLSPLPTPDSDGYYEWEISALDMGVTAIQSGVWYAEVNASTAITQYAADNSPPFTLDVKKKIVDPVMEKLDPLKKCSDCGGKYDVFSAYQTIACNGVCSAEQTTNIINWLYSQKPCC